MRHRNLFPVDGPRLSWWGTLSSIVPYGVRIVLFRGALVNAVVGPVIVLLTGADAWLADGAWGRDGGFREALDFVAQLPKFALLFCLFGTPVGGIISLFLGAPFAALLECRRVRSWRAYLVAGTVAGSLLGAVIGAWIGKSFGFFTIFGTSYGLAYAAAYRWGMLNGAALVDKPVPAAS